MDSRASSQFAPMRRWPVLFPLRVRVVCIVVVCNRAEEFLGVWEILALTRDLLNVVSSSHALRG